MDSNKKTFVNQIRDGQHVEDLFLLKEMSRAETRSGKPYLILTVMDRSGELPARLWDNADALLPECKPGSLVSIAGQAQTYRETLQLKVDTVKSVAAEGQDMLPFLPSSCLDIDHMATRVVSLAQSITEPSYRKLLLKFFNDRSFFADFQVAPAAKNMHHAYLGGLLEHTLSVSRLAEAVSGLYPALDRDLLLTGSLLHDIGKVAELSFHSYPFNYTDQGRLVGHLVLGVTMVQDRINSITDFPDKLAMRLQHLILSHHGRYEFGSPTLPMMGEAFVLNFLDDLDAKLNFMGRLEEHAAEEGYQWSDFQRTLDRFLFIKGRPHQEDNGSGHADDRDMEENQAINSQQQNLF
jgi:3'-5' exoribonuclease